MSVEQFFSFVCNFPKCIRDGPECVANECVGVGVGLGVSANVCDCVLPEKKKKKKKE